MTQKYCDFIDYINLPFYIFSVSCLSINCFNNFFSKTFFLIAFIWLGSIGVAIVWFLIFDLSNLISRKFFNYNLLTPKVGIVVIIVIILVCIYAIINADFIRVRNINLSLSKLKNNIKIVYLSDIHIDTINSISYLKKIINKVNELSGDLVIINGDLVHIWHFSDEDFSSLKDIKAPVIFTYGNHERYFGKERVNKILKWANLNILENQTLNFSGLQIIWLQDLESIDNKSSQDKLNDLLKNIKIDSNLPSILVLHEPIWPAVSQKYWIDLQLAWHTHNGQVFPFNLFVRLWFKYIYWLYNIWWMYLYVSSGAWTWWPPMRLGSDSEIVLFHLSGR